MDTKPLVARLIAAAVAGAAAKLAVKTGIAVDETTQATIVVAVYGGLHSLSKMLFGGKRKGQR